MPTLPTSRMSLAAFSARTMRNWTAKRLRFNVRLKMRIDKAISNTKLNVAQKVRLAGQFLRDAIVVNLSRPVRKYKGPRSGKIQVDPKSRSKPGELPRADTTRLMKSIFAKHYPEQVMSRIGTNLLYGVVLETRLDRSFIRKTLRERRQQLLLFLRTQWKGTGINPLTK